MSDKTLNAYIERLKPAQQDFITFCVKKYGNLYDFHRGKLPFLKASTATLCLKTHLERMQERPDSGTYPGVKFVRQIMSVFADHYGHRLYEDETSEVIFLLSHKLKKLVGPYRMSGKFLIRPARYIWTDPNRLAELQMINRNQWRVTAHKDDIEGVTLWLTDTCR